MAIVLPQEQFKIGVKREVVGALEKAFGPNYPDPDFAARVSVVPEYPTKEISYPMVVFHFNPGLIQNTGLANYEIVTLDDGEQAVVKRWRFEGSFTLTAYALSAYDRDLLILGLINMFAFGDQIPAFQTFWKEIRDYDWVELQINTDSIQESGDQVVSVPWSDDEIPVFTDSITLQVLGEFYTDPQTGGLVQISRINLFPYRPGMTQPTGSQAHVGTFGQPGYLDDRTVPWQDA